MSAPRYRERVLGFSPSDWARQ